MAGPRIIPRGMQFWPSIDEPLGADNVVRMYDQGFAGAYEEPDETEAFEDLIRERGGTPDGEQVAMSAGFAESGKGRLSLPFIHAVEMLPGCLPGPAQQRGDCVAHDQKNANLVTYACEVAAGLPDEVTGNIERMPEISAEGIRQGAFSTEVYYWFRRHGGDGWSCDAAARVAMREAGKVTRANHPGIGVDLTRYSGRNAGRYGRNPPTGEVANAVNNNLIRNATTLRSVDSWRDMLANGYALSTCGSEGFARTRDQHGVSRRSGSWAHAMAFIGFDDRAWARQTYSGPLVLVQNSWAVWNSGPRDIHDSAKYVPAEKRQLWVDAGLVNRDTGNIMIPQGAFWARSSDVSRRRVIAKSGVDGWPRLGAPLDLGVEGWQ